MIIYFGADHGGFELKAHLMEVLRSQGYEVEDMGDTKIVEDDDYPDFARAVAEKVATDTERQRGVLICRSGVGMDVVANKFANIRSVLAISGDHVYAARHDDDVNILTIASDFTDKAQAEKMLEVFMTTPFGADQRYKRRLEKISEIENQNFVQK